MYENIKKAIAAHEAERIQKAAERIHGKTAGELLNNWGTSQYTTPATHKALQEMPADAIPDPAIIAKLEAKAARIEKKYSAERLAKVEAAEQARPLDHFNVAVEWHRSRIWGYNPRATVEGYYARTQDGASGCGYDKESAAIAGAMNMNPEIMRILYDHAEKGLPFPYSVHVFGGVPSFDGGCGVSCFRSVFEACGYEWRQVASGEMFNAYTAAKIPEA